ncbi:8901_t:CDS:2, partial [Funneliformis caledonium]
RLTAPNPAIQHWRTHQKALHFKQFPNLGCKSIKGRQAKLFPKLEMCSS